MKQTAWYLIAYDVSDNRRLQRVHYYLRKRALAAQRSVFFFHGAEAELKDVLDALAGIIHRRKDDLRAYPISHPSQVWLTGQTAVSGALLMPSETSINQRPPAQEIRAQGVRGLVTRLWRKRNGQ